jgi:hypothetical protein
MSTNLEGRVRKLEGANGNTDRKIHVVMLPQDRTLEQALADAGIEPTSTDMVVWIKTYGDAEQVHHNPDQAIALQPPTFAAKRHGK